MDDLVSFTLTMYPVPDGVPRSGVREELTYPRFLNIAMIQGFWTCVSMYVGRGRDRSKQDEEGTSKSYKNELFLLGVSSGERGVSGYL